MTGHAGSLDPAVQDTLREWHRFVETKSADVLRPLFADITVFRSPFTHLPIPGPPASVLILTAVVQIFENFRYDRSFMAGTHDVALEFSATIGDQPLKGVDLIKFDPAGKIAEFEVMIRPIRTLEALSTLLSARIGPELAKYKTAAAT